MDAIALSILAGLFVGMALLVQSPLIIGFFVSGYLVYRGMELNA